MRYGARVDPGKRQANSRRQLTDYKVAIAKDVLWRPIVVENDRIEFDARQPLQISRTLSATAEVLPYLSWL